MGCHWSSLNESEIVDVQSPINDGTKFPSKRSGSFQTTEAVVVAMLRNRRKQVFDESTDVANISIDVPTSDKQETKKSGEDTRLITQALKSNMLFKQLSKENFNCVINSMAVESIKGGQEVIKQGDTGSKFYIVRSGEFNVLVDGNEVSVLRPGNVFGELALIYNCPRAASVVCKPGLGGKVFSLDRKTFRNQIATNSLGNFQCTKDILQKVPILKVLTESQLGIIANSVQAIKFNFGDTIIKKGQPGEVFYMIQEGEVRCTELGDGNLQDIILHAGDYFGERALVNNSSREATIIANSEVTLLAVGSETFSNVMGRIKDSFRTNHLIRELQSISLLSMLNFEEQQAIAVAITRKTYRDKEKIFQQGDTGTEFYVIKSGKVTVSMNIPKEDGDEKGGSSETEIEIATLVEGNYFGEMALLDPEKKRGATITAVGETECLILDQKNFGSNLKHLHTIIKRDARERTRRNESRILSIRLRLEDFEFSSVLGMGTFGCVRLAKHVKSGKWMAAKIMIKSQIEESGQLKHIHNEKKYLESFQSPFILNYVGCLQDDFKVYIFTELLLGGELFRVIVDESGLSRPISTKKARFYAGCTIEALEYMHERKVAYRDLKPENIMIDESGYAKIVDLGFAKKIEGKTFTLCGTPEYLAPEIVLGTGHGIGVDYWSLGVLLYEMVVGDSPFSDPEDNHMNICNNILQRGIKYPKNSCSEWKSLVDQLLQPELKYRLGCLKGGTGDIKAHRFFEKFDWVKLQSREIEAPWKPELKTEIDCTYIAEVLPEEVRMMEHYASILPKTDWSTF